MSRTILKKGRFLLILITLLAGIITIAGCSSGSSSDSHIDSGSGGDDTGDTPGGDDTDDLIPVVDPEVDPDFTDKSYLKNLLYVVHAGIGYMDADSEEDNEPLYNVMVSDLNMAVGTIIMEIVQNYNEDLTWKELLSSNQTITYTNSSDLYTAELVYTVDYKTFSYGGTLSIDFNTSGFTIGDHTYYGEPGSDDLVVTIEGSVAFSPEFSIELGNITITAEKGLEAVYQLGGAESNVTYGIDNNSWEISYNIDGKNNAYLIPSEEAKELLVGSFSSDNRDYTIGGSFAIDGKTYTFKDGFHYVQVQIQFALLDYGTAVFMEGSVKLPGVKYVKVVPSVTISSDTLLSYFSDIISKDDSILNDIIRRDIPSKPMFGNIDEATIGIWASGMLTFSNEDDSEEIAVSFSLDDETSTATFDDEWSVDNWQDTLDIF